VSNIYDLKYLKKIRHGGDVPLKVPVGFDFVGLPPFPHQVVTLIYGLYHNDLAIFSTMGTGKSRSSIDICRHRLQNGEANKILVVAPTSVLGNWKDEVEKFSEYNAVVLHHPNREHRIKLFKSNTEFYIINYEATLYFLKYILKLDADIVIFDESSRISNPKAKQTKACTEIAGHTKYRLILNGTPVSNKPLDLWSQFYALDFGDTLGDSFAIYKRIYFKGIKMKSRQGKYFSVYKVRNDVAMEDIAKRISTKSIRYTKEECVRDLPEKTFQRRLLELPTSSRILYNEMYENAKLEIARMKQNISAHIMLTKFVKALQITSGYIKTDEGNFIRLKKNPKLRELKLLLEEIVPEDACIIWCKYLYTIELVERMLDKMGIDHLTIKGEVKDKSGVAKLFQNTSREDIPVLIGQIRSGGVGLNLHKASFEIFMENEWRLLDREQAIDRCHRIGQKRPVTVIDLIMRDTIDEQILQAISKKQSIAEYILQRVK
jgi:SNF2 family DNA or RNA helicase